MSTDLSHLIKSINDLSDKNNVSVNKMLLDCGLSKSVVDNMKKGSIPTIDKIQKIAEYFSVSTDYLLGTENKKSSNPEGAELKGVYLNFAMDAQENGIDPDDIKLAIETIKRLRGQDNK